MNSSLRAKRSKKQQWQTRSNHCEPNEVNLKMQRSARDEGASDRGLKAQILWLIALAYQS